MAEQMGAKEVLFDQSLSPAQQRNLERHLELPVNDRTLLILENKVVKLEAVLL
jgi:GTP-binding protein HflX